MVCRQPGPNLGLPPHRAAAESWQRQGANTMIMTPDEFGAYIQSEIERWAKVIRANNIGIN